MYRPVRSGNEKTSMAYRQVYWLKLAYNERMCDFISYPHASIMHHIDVEERNNDAQLIVSRI